jgi:hypothetical protein
MGVPRPVKRPTRVTHLCRGYEVFIHEVLRSYFSMGWVHGVKLGDASGGLFYKMRHPNGTDLDDWDAWV